MLLLCCFWLLFAQPGRAVDCYWPDGTPRGYPNTYQPCNGVSGMCCAIARSDAPDVCLQNGLCYYAAGDLLWRESCTDPTWQSSECLKLCDNGIIDNQDAADNDVIISPCNDGSYCCGYNNTLCCQAREGIFISGEISNGSTLIITSTSTTTDYTTIAAIETSPLATSPSSSSSVKHSGFPTSAIIGISVSVPTVILIALILGWLYLRERHRLRLLQNGQGAGKASVVDPPMERKKAPSSHFYPVEPTPIVRSELGSSTSPVVPELEAINNEELEGNGRTQRRNYTM